LAPAPLITFQRLEARIEIDSAEFRRPEHIEELLGREMKKSDVAKLREMSVNDPELLDVLYRTGEALGAAQLISNATQDEAHPVRGQAIAPDWPPPSFDPPAWRAPTPPAPEAPPASEPSQT
jgi:hypothetical protein